MLIIALGYGTQKVLNLTDLIKSMILAQPSITVHGKLSQKNDFLTFVACIDVKIHLVSEIPRCI